MGVFWGAFSITTVFCKRQWFFLCNITELLVSRWDISFCIEKLWGTYTEKCVDPTAFLPNLNVDPCLKASPPPLLPRHEGVVTMLWLCPYFDLERGFHEISINLIQSVMSMYRWFIIGVSQNNVWVIHLGLHRNSGFWIEDTHQSYYKKASEETIAKCLSNNRKTVSTVW